MNLKNAHFEGLRHRFGDFSPKQIKPSDNKEELSKEEIDYFVKGYTEGTITDYQAAALVMAIYINGDVHGEPIRRLSSKYFFEQNKFKES
mgnify:CR=1 FL=1